jgi:hypothetical protein
MIKYYLGLFYIWYCLMAAVKFRTIPWRQYLSLFCFMRAVLPRIVSWRQYYLGLSHPGIINSDYFMAAVL